MTEPKEKVSSFLNKEMTRKEFLGFMGMAFLGLIGVGSLLTYLKGNTNNSSSGLRYGSGPYGGVTKE